MRRTAHGRRAASGVALALLLGALGAGCGGSAAGHRTADKVAAIAAPPVPARRPPAVQLPPGSAALRASVSKQFALAGPSSGGAVYDLTDRVSLYALRDGVSRPPASVEKLYTSVALLNEFGPSATFQTKVVGSGFLGAGGIWHGSLFLVGGGDPTLGDGGFNRNFELGYGPTAAQLARQLEADGIRRVSGRLIGDGSLFDDRVGPPSSGFAPDVGDLGGELSGLTYDHGATARGWMAPAAFAAHELALTLRAAHVHVTAARHPGVAPAGARQLATVSSPSLWALVKLMDVPSDDFFAEMLTKQLGMRFGAGGTTAAGAAVIAGQIATFGLHPAIVDGSGLSRSDRTSPRDVVALLRALHGTTTGYELYSSLPVVGVSGTTRTVAMRTAASGACEAKTGTLNNVTNLAGWCHSRGGKLVVFALFIDGPANWRALQLEGSMVGAIARF